MKKIFILLMLASTQLFAQVPGDTIVVQTFNYANAGEKLTRDSVFHFPDLAGVSFSKVLMKYNMRCKDGLVSPGTAGQTNIGCGEWDYSCNTYITDSTRADSLAGSIPSHTISGFSGTTYNYTNIPYYNTYQYPQTNTTVTSILSETQSLIGPSVGTINLSDVIAANKKAGRSQYLFTAAELLTAGLTAGDIAGIMLHANSVSTANFLHIGIQHTTLNTLQANNPLVSGFTSVFQNHASFVTGSNRLQFNTAFVWDGVSNIVIDFSFTNSTPASVLNLQGSNVAANYGLVANNNSYINTAQLGNANVNATAFSAISNEITISFWSRGNIGASTKNSSIIEGTDLANRRQLNIHMPWSNNNIYFDCGGDAGGYDRINKQATVAETEQNWNYWTFTKNATTGVMNIYLNGNSWQSGTGKTRPIDIKNLVLGIDAGKSFIFSGDIDELSVFNAELSQATIQAWMNKSINATHPNYANLVAYYPMNEGVGGSISDASTNAQFASFNNPTTWKYLRGNEIARNFSETMERPNVTFLQGSYVQTNSSINSLDSMLAIQNWVKTFTVYPKPGTLKNDSTGYIGTSYYHASFKYSYDGITGAIIDSTAIPSTGTINITNLPFMNRYPSKYEIMSFVTPYGINLNLGPTGKTWTFDVTDYLPILKGSRRMTMERGGERQEDMDIKFLFIVGTPVRDVKDITNIWRQPGNCSYTQILDDTYFEPRNVNMNAAAKFFKMRTMITGHGQEGEFIPQQHFLKVNGTQQDIWTVEKKCGWNPVYPQGGTWIYDRAGWCPGMASLMHETDITSHVTAGQSANLDYGLVTAQGTSNYIVSSFLVHYGDYNFSRDAAIVDILAPTNKVEYAREQAICRNPTIKIQNTGAENLTSLTIYYWVNNNSAKNYFHWVGSLAPNATEDVVLPSNDQLWSALATSGNQFHVEVSLPNETTDGYELNNKMKSDFVITDVVPRDFVVHYVTNSQPNETTIQIIDHAGNILLNKSNLAPNTSYKDTMRLDYGCFKMIVTDTDEDGISFWANNDGSGTLRFLKIPSGTYKTFNGDFGAGLIYNFTTAVPLANNDLLQNEAELVVYPNPTSDVLNVDLTNLEQVTNVQFCDIKGTVLKETVINTDKLINFSTKNYPQGVYFVKIVAKNGVIFKKILVEHD